MYAVAVGPYPGARCDDRATLWRLRSPAAETVMTQHYSDESVPASTRSVLMEIIEQLRGRRALNVPMKQKVLHYFSIIQWHICCYCSKIYKNNWAAYSTLWKILFDGSAKIAQYRSLYTCRSSANMASVVEIVASSKSRKNIMNIIQ